MQDEIWKPVLSKPGLMVSSYGRIKLPESIGVMPNGGIRVYKTKPIYGVVMRSNSTAKHSYMGIVSRKFGTMKIHRLVCEAFHGPPPTKNSVVIHIDENAHNNNANNLRWGTQKENLNCPGFIQYCKSRVGDKNPNVKGRRKKST